jgi:hypothetical protein
MMKDKKNFFLNCFKLIYLLFSLVEDRSNLYEEARKCLEKVSSKESQGNIPCSDKLIHFLKMWNKARGYKDEEAKEIVKAAINFTKDVEALNKEVIPKRKRNNREEVEFIGFIKVLHILHPQEFPLIDNPIGESLKILKNSMKVDRKVENYKILKTCLDEIINNYDFNSINIDGFTLYPYKIIDEFLFLIISKNRENILKELKKSEEIFTENAKECLKIFFEIKEKLQQCLQKKLELEKN